MIYDLMVFFQLLCFLFFLMIPVYAFYYKKRTDKFDKMISFKSRHGLPLYDERKRILTDSLSNTLKSKNGNKMKTEASSHRHLPFSMKEIV